MMWMMNQNKLRMQNLDKMCCMLMKDIGESYAIPADLKGKQQMLRGLMNLRYPIAMNADFLTLQDKELQMQRKEKGEVSVGDISKDDAALILWQGDITRLRVDAIVNAANSQMLGCFQPLHSCIDNAIHSAAGIQLRDICNRMMMKQGNPEATGKAKITAGFNLPARYVIHTVGPIIPDGEPTREQCAQLASCYHECLQLAERNGLESIAFCCISTGVFRFPNQLAAEIAVREVKSFMNQAKYTSNPQPIGFSGILLAKRQNSFYCTYFLHNRNVADTKSPYPIKRLEVIRWFYQKSMVFNQSLS